MEFCGLRMDRIVDSGDENNSIYLSSGLTTSGLYTLVIQKG